MAYRLSIRPSIHNVRPNTHILRLETSVSSCLSLFFHFKLSRFSFFRSLIHSPFSFPLSFFPPLSTTIRYHLFFLIFLLLSFARFLSLLSTPYISPIHMILLLFHTIYIFFPSFSQYLLSLISLPNLNLAILLYLLSPTLP